MVRRAISCPPASKGYTQPTHPDFAIRTRGEAVPSNVEMLHDDPYRTLAWLVRKDQGFCRELMQQKEFAEFLWADWFRNRPELPREQVLASPQSMSAIALALATGKEAEHQSGFRGVQPAGFKCPKKLK